MMFQTTNLAGLMRPKILRFDIVSNIEMAY